MVTSSTGPLAVVAIVGRGGPFRSRPAALALCLALVASLAQAWGIAPARGADDTNIPGVPLPGPVVTGQLGGPIYDHVYSVDIPAQRILLISLIGDPGTDFDLYLFNSTATTIYSTQGQVATSKGPTSTESIAYTVVGADRFYINLNGATNVQGEFRLNVQVLQDSTAPRVTLVLEGGAPATQNATVSVTVVATDDLAGVGEMQFSTDGSSWFPWQPYAPTILWSFPSSDGTIRLWGRVRDRAGNLSMPANASIVLDTFAPMVVSVAPPAGGTTTGLQPNIQVTFSEPILASSWATSGLLVQDATGTVAYGAYSVDASATVGMFRPGSPLAAGSTYVVTLGSVVDLAGNAVSSPTSWTIRALSQPVASLFATERVVARGAQVQLTGSIEGRAGGALVLERSVAGGPWEPKSPILDPSASVVGTIVTVDFNTSFRLHYIGNNVSADAFSPTVRVLVRRGVAFSGVSSATTHTSTVGRTRTFTARLTPTTPQVPVTLHVLRYDSVSRRYVLRTSLVRASASGTASFSWRPTARGRYLLRLTTPSTPGFANGISRSYRWDIR